MEWSTAQCSRKCDTGYQFGIGAFMIDIAKGKGCDSCGTDCCEMYVLKVGKFKKIKLCWKCVKELEVVVDDIIRSQNRV